MKNEVDKDKDFDVDEFYQDAAKTFVNGFTDEDEIQEFIDEYFDPKAYVAYENVELDDSRFYEEYVNLDDNDERIEEISEKALNIPTALEQAKELMKALSENLDDTTMSDDEGNEIDMSDIELNFTLEDISEPEISDQDENITKITITIGMFGQEQEFDMIFYDTVVIYIMDSDGNSFLDGIQWVEE